MNLFTYFDKLSKCLGSVYMQCIKWDNLPTNYSEYSLIGHIILKQIHLYGYAIQVIRHLAILPFAILL